MSVSDYIFGPQIVGLIMALVGLIMHKFPPKKINSLYGYRTNSSMKNQQTWDEANRYSAKLMMWIGFILSIAGVAITLLVGSLVTDKSTTSGLMAGITIASAILPAVILIAQTESHLDKTFNKKNEIR